MSIATCALLVGAGLAAGLAGSIAGLASLFSYPALLAVGLPPTAASVTNTVSIAVSCLGSMASSRPELAGQGGQVRRLGGVCALGGAVGAGLLLVTPSGVFEKIVPLLVGGASAVLLMPRSLVGATGDGVPWRRPLVLAGTLAVSVYGGYFGAAAGVLMLALLLSALPDSLVRANALKNLLLGLSSSIAAIGYALFGPVAWLAAVPLSVGLFIGAWWGPPLARRLPSRVLRTVIGVAGLGLAAKLGWATFGTS